MSKPVISIIIPCWRNDLSKTLDLVRNVSCPPDVEWIVAMADPPENWKNQIAEIDKSNFTLIECSQPGRGSQMNEGAESAQGEILLFHHCDSDLEEGHLISLMEATQTDLLAGAFHRVLDDRHPWLLKFNAFVRWYNQHWGILFGDQSFFIRRDFFQELGGFRPIKLMEDVEMSRRVRKRTKIVLLDPPILSSQRRSTFYGAWKVTLVNFCMLMLYRCGVSTDALHSFYYKNWKIK